MKKSVTMHNQDKPFGIRIEQLQAQSNNFYGTILIYKKKSILCNFENVLQNNKKFKLYCC